MIMVNQQSVEHGVGINIYVPAPSYSKSDIMIELVFYVT